VALFIAGTVFRTAHHRLVRLVSSLFGHEDVIRRERELLPVVRYVAHAMARVHLKPRVLISCTFLGS
jgi:hypothetical protein